MNSKNSFESEISLENILTNNTTLPSNNMKSLIKAEISSQAEFCRKEIKKNKFLKDEIFYIEKKSELIKNQIENYYSNNLNSEENKINLILDLTKINVELKEKISDLKYENKINFDKNNQLKILLENSNKNLNEELEKIQEKFFLLKNLLNYKDNLIRKLNNDLFSFNLIQEYKREIYIKNNDDNFDFDNLFKNYSNFIQDKLFKTMKKLKKIEVKNKILDNKINNLIIELKLNLNPNNYLKIKHTIIMETTKENYEDFEENQINSDDEDNNNNINKINKEFFFEEFDMSSLDENSIDENTNSNNIKFFNIPANVTMKKMNLNNMKNIKKLNSSDNVIPKLNLKLIEFNRNQINNESKISNLSKINKKSLNDSFLDDEIDEMKKNIKKIKNQISNKKKLIKKFKLYVKKIIKFFDKNILFGYNNKNIETLINFTTNNNNNIKINNEINVNLDEYKI